MKTIPFPKQPRTPEGYKPSLVADIQNAINELLLATQIPPLIRDGFMLRINAAFANNEIKLPDKEV